MIKNTKSTSNSIPNKHIAHKQQELNALKNSKNQDQSGSNKKFQRKSQNSPMNCHKIKSRNNSLRIAVQQNPKGANNMRLLNQCIYSQEKLRLYNNNQSQIKKLQTSMFMNPLFIKKSQFCKLMHEGNNKLTKKQMTTCQTIMDQMNFQQNKQNEASKNTLNKKSKSIQQLTLKSNLINNSHQYYEKSEKKQANNKNTCHSLLIEESNKKSQVMISIMQKQMQQLRKAKIQTQSKYRKLQNEHKQALKYIELLSKLKIPQSTRQLQSFKQISLQTQIYDLKHQLQKSKQQRQRTLEQQLENSKILINQLQADVKSLQINSNILERRNFNAELQCKTHKKSISEISHQQSVIKINEQNKALKKRITYLENYLNQLKIMMNKEYKTNCKYKPNSNIQKDDMDYSDEDTISFMLVDKSSLNK